MVKFFSTHCPKCKVIKTKLDKGDIEYVEIDDIDKMLSLGLKSAPNLQLEDGTILDFSDALKWINEQINGK